MWSTLYVLLRLIPIPTTLEFSHACYIPALLHRLFWSIRLTAYPAVFLSIRFFYWVPRIMKSVFKNGEHENVYTCNLPPIRCNWTEELITTGLYSCLASTLWKYTNRYRRYWLQMINHRIFILDSSLLSFPLTIA